MKKIFEKVLKYDAVLIITGFIFVVMVGAALAIDQNDSFIDSDEDGVSDSADMCPNTVPDKSSDWGINRYLWFGGDVNFFIMNGSDGSKAPSEFSSVDTKGCSCADILKTRKGSDSAGQYKSGCTKGTLEEWIKKVNR